MPPDTGSSRLTWTASRNVSWFEFERNLVFSGSSSTPDEGFLYFTCSHAHPEVLRGGWVTMPLAEACYQEGIEPEFTITDT